MSLLPKCPKCGTIWSFAAEGRLCNVCQNPESDALTRLDISTTPSVATKVDVDQKGAPTSVRFKDYEVLSEIARGGMGVIYKARQVKLNRVVAVKVIRSGEIAAASEIQRFLIEARAVATLQHPNIVAIHDIGEDAGHHFFSMDFVEGQNLDELVRKHSLPSRDCALLVRQIAEAIHYAHQRGILHRDLKPSNVLVDQHLQPRITDFGLAKLVSDDSAMTMSGTIMGSPSYMPPEQAEGRTDEITVRSDIYSLGAILYQLLTRKPPFSAESPLATLKLVLEQEPTQPRQLNARVPRDLETICLKCLEKRPAKRFGSAHEVAEELDRFLTNQPIRSRSHGPIERTWRWCRRKPAVAAALMIFFCGFVGVFWQWRRAEALAISEAVLRHGAEQSSVDALMAQARVERASGVAGQRHRSLAALEKAARIRPTSELRNEIAACLPLIDLRLARSWQADLKPTSVLAFDSPLNRYALADGAREISINDIGSKKAILTFPGNGKLISALQFSPDGKLLATASDGAFSVWEIEQQRILFQNTNFNGGVVFDFSPDSIRIVAGDATGAIQIYELNSGQRRLSLGIGRPCGAIRFDPGGGRLAVVSRESLNLFLFDSGTGEEINRIAHPAVLNDVAWHPSGSLVATACGDGQIYGWDPKGTERSLLRGHTAPPRQIVFSNHGSFIASLGEDATLRIWEATTGHPLVRWDGVSRSILRFSPDDRTLACNVGNSTPSEIQLLEVTWPKEVRSIPDEPSDARLFGPGVFVENGRLLVIPVEEGLHLWDPVSGKQLDPILIGRVQAVGFPTGASNLLVRGFYGTHRLPVTHSMLQSKVLLFGPPVFLDCDPGDGVMVAVGKDKLAICEEDQISLIDVQSGELLIKIRAKPGLKTFAGSANGNWIAGSNWKTGDVTIWNSAGNLVTNLPVRDPAQIAFSPDSACLATTTESQCHLWQVGVWNLQRTLRRQRPGVHPAPLAFSPDGMTLAWATSDDLVSLVTRTNGDDFLALPSPGQSAITSITFTPSGGGLLIGGVGWPLTLWDLGSIQEKILQCGLPFEPLRKFSRGWPNETVPLPAVFLNGNKMERTQQAREDLHRLETLLLIEPNDLEAWKQLARINSSFYRFTPAVKAYERVLRLSPQDLPCSAEAAYALVKLKRFAEAAELYKNILARDPDNLNASQQLAYLYLHALTTNRDLGLGRKFAEQAFQTNPKDALSLFWLGVAEYRSGKLHEALDLLNRALAANPPTQTFLFYQAMCLAKLGRKEEALKSFQEALDRVASRPASFVEHREHFESFINEARAICVPNEEL